MGHRPQCRAHVLPHDGCDNGEWVQGHSLEFWCMPVRHFHSRKTVNLRRTRRKRGRKRRREALGHTLGPPSSITSIQLQSRRIESSGCRQLWAGFVFCLIFFMATQMPVSLMLTYVRGEVHSEHKLSILSWTSGSGIPPDGLEPARLPSHFQLCRSKEGAWAELPKCALRQACAQEQSLTLLGSRERARCKRSIQVLDVLEEGGLSHHGGWLGSTPPGSISVQWEFLSAKLWMFGNHLVPGGSIPWH